MGQHCCPQQWPTSMLFRVWPYVALLRVAEKINVAGEYRVALFLGNSCDEDKRDRQFYDVTLASYPRLCASALSSLLKHTI